MWGCACTAQVNCPFSLGVREKFMLTRSFVPLENGAPPQSNSGLFLINGACSGLNHLQTARRHYTLAV